MAIKMVTQGYADINGTQIYYEMAGQGEPLVLIHARLLHSGQWDDQFLEFAEQYRVIRYDVRGFGKSRMTRFGSDVEDLAALLDYLKLDQVHLLGLSMGSEIALNFVLEHPDRVLSLELISPGLDGYEYSEHAMHEWQKFITPVLAHHFENAMDVFTSTWIDGPIAPADPAVRERAREMMQGYNFAHYFPPDEQMTEILEPAAVMHYRSPCDRLAEVQIPTLIVTGTQDQPDVIAIGKVLHKGIRGSMLESIPGAAHMVNLQQPSIFNGLIMKFLHHLR